MNVVLAPLNPTVGDVEGNAALVLAAAREASGADLVMLPELCLSGYPPRDLLLHESFVAACERAAEALTRELPEGPTVVFGAPLPGPNGGVTNSLIAARRGERLARYDKRLLPTYDVFDEWRYFVPGDRPVVIEVAGQRVGLSICEDLWRGADAHAERRYAGEADPVAELVAAGATVIVNPSASPFVSGKHERHRDIVTTHARRHGIPVLSVNQFGANDDLIFDGAALAVDARAVDEAPRWTGRPLRIDLARHEPARLESPHPVDELIEALTLGVRDYAAKCGFHTACLGLSGGIDSAVTAAIAARAIGHQHVLGVAMPGKYSSPHSIEDAHDLAGRLGCAIEDAPIDMPFEGFRDRLDRVLMAMGERPLGRQLPDLTEENLQSRVRGTIMMAVSNRTGALLLTTGNKSELAVGYGTLYGDMNGGLAVLSDLLKHEVYTAARRLNERHDAFGFARPPIPESTITKPPSAELAPGQKDEDSLPPYDVLDEIVRRRVELRESAEQIVAATGFDADTVREMLRKISFNEYKRFQLAIGLKVSRVAFGPGRRMPLAARRSD